MDWQWEGKPRAEAADGKNGVLYGVSRTAHGWLTGGSRVALGRPRAKRESQVSRRGLSSQEIKDTHGEVLG